MKVVSVVAYRVTLVVTAVFLSLFFLTGSALGDEDKGEDGSGAVYLMTNQASGNTVVMFHRAADGSLVRTVEVSTGGLGSGPGVLPPPLPPNPGPDPLQSQDALISTENGRFLLVVNAGSNDISVLAVNERGITLVDRASSGGVFPVSLAIHKNLVYVLNEGESPDHIQGGTTNIKGFLLDAVGKLHEIPDSTSVLGTDTGASDILFSPNGKQLIVTEMFTNMIDVFQMDTGGLAAQKVSLPSNSPTPFGASFGRQNILAVTEIDVITVNGRRQGVANASTVSSYRLSDAGTLQLISKSVASNKTGSCWTRFSKDGRFAYTSDTGSGTISVFSSAKGDLSLVGPVSTGGAFSAPLDMDITPDGKFVYVVGALTQVAHVPPILALPPTPGRIQGYRVESDGSLTPVTTVGGIPFSAQGIVAR
jgi:6-phosphogluconolactonase (cycloisomerase 2 family)